MCVAGEVAVFLPIWHHDQPFRLVHQCDATDNRIQGVFSGRPWLTNHATVVFKSLHQYSVWHPIQTHCGNQSEMASM